MPDDVLTEAEQIKMLQALHRLTDMGTAEWGREGVSTWPDARELSTPDGRFKFIMRSRDRDGERPYDLFVSLNRGDGVFRRFAVIRMMAADEGGSMPVNNSLEDLYIKAHRRPASEQTIIDAMFDALGNPGGDA